MSYIKKIKIKNFRLLEDASFEIKPLTLLLGPNGSGKSTLLKALLFLEKNIENNRIADDDYYYDISKDIKLGGFKDIVSNGDINKIISFEFVINTKEIADEFSEDYYISIIYNFSFNKDVNDIISEKIIDHDNELTFFTFSGRINKLNSHVGHLNFLFTDVDLMEYEKCYPKTYNDFMQTELFYLAKLKFKDYEENYYNDEKIFYDYEGRRIYEYNNYDFDEDDINDRDEWEKLSSEEKNKLYHQFRKMHFVKCYFLNVIRNIVKEFLKIIRAPTVRNSIKDVYYLSDRKFNDYDNDEYYGLLRYLEDSSLASFVNINSNNYLHKVIEDFHIMNVLKYCLHNNITLIYVCDLEVLCENYEEAILSIEEKIKNEDILSNLGGKFLDTINLDKHQKREIMRNILKTFLHLGKKKYDYFIEIIRNSTFFTWLLLDYMDENNVRYLMNKELILRYINLDVKDYFIESHFEMDSLSNYWLNVVGFQYAVIVDKSNDIAKFNVRKVNYIEKVLYENPHNANFESSGFQQIYPVILFLSYIISTLKNKGIILDDKYLDDISYPLGNIKTFYIEQPELHLHPAFQTKIPLLFSDFLLFSRRLTYNINSTLFIETHSEHIIRKLQLMVAKNEISINDIAINYIDSDGNNTSVKELRLSENGDFLDPWPNGFFDEAAELAFELMKAQKNRNN